MERKFAFVSRHEATPEQIEIAAQHGITLEAVGDLDAFNFGMSSGKGGKHLIHDYSGVIVAHAWMALQFAARGQTVGVFENAMRPVEGGKPTFEAKSLRVMEALYDSSGAVYFHESKQPGHDGLPNPDDPIYEEEIHS
jgi:hypothetical protein